MAQVRFFTAEDLAWRNLEYIGPDKKAGPWQPFREHDHKTSTDIVGELREVFTKVGDDKWTGTLEKREQRAKPLTSTPLGHDLG